MEKVFKLFFFPCEHFWNFKLTTVHFFQSFCLLITQRFDGGPVPWFLFIFTPKFDGGPDQWFLFVLSAMDLICLPFLWHEISMLHWSSPPLIWKRSLMVNLIFITEFIEYVAQGSLLKQNDLSNLSEYILL